jgi:hypothetical protein
MKTNSATASGSTNGAIFIPIADSIWPRIWVVMASQNSCTPLGTPVEVTLARRKNANARVMIAAIAVASTVSVFTVMPKPVGGGVVADLDRALGEDSFTHRAQSFGASSAVADAGGAGLRAYLFTVFASAHFLPHRQRRTQNEQNLEQSQAEQHTKAGRPENERDGQADRADDQKAGGGVQRHLPLEGMVPGGDRLHRALDEHGVGQPECEADTEEDTDHDVAGHCGQTNRHRGQCGADRKQPKGPEGNRRKHQRRILRWCRHRFTSILRSRELSG